MTVSIIFSLVFCIQKKREIYSFGLPMPMLSLSSHVLSLHFDFSMLLPFSLNIYLFFLLCIMGSRPPPPFLLWFIHSGLSVEMEWKKYRGYEYGRFRLWFNWADDTHTHTIVIMIFIVSKIYFFCFVCFIRTTWIDGKVLPSWYSVFIHHFINAAFKTCKTKSIFFLNEFIWCDSLDCDI